MKSNPSIKVTGSHGAFLIDDTGHILSKQIETKETETGLHLKSIMRFDMREWRDWYCKTGLPAHIDILDLGYWYLTPGEILWSYSPPDNDWRGLMIEKYNQDNRALDKVGKGELNAKH